LMTPARPWRSQLAAAGAAETRAPVAVVVGENEARAGLAVVKDMRGRTEKTVPLGEVEDEVWRVLGRY